MPVAKAIRSQYMTWTVAEARRKMKIRSVLYKGGACSDCGYKKSYAALDFHHTDPSKKDFQLGRTILSWERTRRELDKCVLLCSNCHREEHERQHQAEHERRGHALKELMATRRKARQAERFAGLASLGSAPVS